MIWDVLMIPAQPNRGWASIICDFDRFWWEFAHFFEFWVPLKKMLFLIYFQNNSFFLN